MTLTPQFNQKLDRDRWISELDRPTLLCSTATYSVAVDRVYQSIDEDLGEPRVVRATGLLSDVIVALGVPLSGAAAKKYIVVETPVKLPSNLPLLIPLSVRHAVRGHGARREIQTRRGANLSHKAVHPARSGAVLLV